MPHGICLITWDAIHGGAVSLSVPEDMEVPENTVQQIQISHNFTTSYIITEESNWNSISFYNEETEIITVIKLDKYEEGQDFVQLLQEIDDQLAVTEEKNRKHVLQDFYERSFLVFKTRDEVIRKLADEVAELKMLIHEIDTKLLSLMETAKLNTTQKVLLSLIRVEKRTYNDLKQVTNTSDHWLKKALDKLEKQGLVEYDKKKDWIYIA
jgi:hypothetical protein